MAKKVQTDPPEVRQLWRMLRKLDADGEWQTQERLSNGRRREGRADLDYAVWSDVRKGFLTCKVFDRLPSPDAIEELAARAHVLGTGFSVGDNGRAVAYRTGKARYWLVAWYARRPNRFLMLVTALDGWLAELQEEKKNA